MNAIPAPNAKNAIMATCLMIKINVSNNPVSKTIVWNAHDMGTVRNANTPITPSMEDVSYPVQDIIKKSTQETVSPNLHVTQINKPTYGK